MPRNCRSESPAFGHIDWHCVIGNNFPHIFDLGLERLYVLVILLNGNVSFIVLFDQYFFFCSHALQSVRQGFRIRLQFLSFLDKLL